MHLNGCPYVTMCRISYSLGSSIPVRSGAIPLVETGNGNNADSILSAQWSGNDVLLQVFKDKTFFGKCFHAFIAIIM
jgi:hypothetical protein